MGALRNTYVNLHRDDGRPVPWEPPDIPEGVRSDSVYFGRVLVEMDRRLDAGGLTVYVTGSIDSLPSYGPDVVVLLIGEELTRAPHYSGRVRAIFTNLAARPQLPANVLRDPTWINLWSTVGTARMWAHHLPGRARLLRRRRRGERSAPIWHLPIGVLDQLDLPLKPLAERARDVFFAGSVSHHSGAIKERIRPKTLSRVSMLKNAEQLALRHPELSVELVATEGFLASLAADSAAYCSALMDSRIALVPRGATTDTCRFWQALRYGCIAVVDVVPRHPWFYDGAPVVELRSWDELADVVVALLADEARLDDLHRRSLAWWRTRGSEEAVGAYMADRLNELSRERR